MLRNRIYLTIFTVLTFILASKLSVGQVVVDYTTPGQHTFTVPANTYQITVEAWGGGGAGGAAKNGRGGGGGGGAYVRSVINVTPNTTYNLMVADAKASTLTSTAAQNKGNASWFGTTATLFAEGGNGGGLSSSATGGTGGGVNSIGTVKFAGGNGNAGIDGGTGGGGAGSTQNGGNATALTGGVGGLLNGGNGADLTGNNAPGLPGLNYGGGGAGAQSQNNNQTDIGGAGAQGMIRITYGASTLAATATSTPSCQGYNPGTGSITVTASGGVAPYTYQLGTGSFQSSAVFSNLFAGTYSVTVKDNANSTVTINNIIVGTTINTWTGSVDINWNNSANWTCSVPTLTVDAVIPSGLTRYPVLSTGAAGMCRNLQIASGAQVTVQNNTLSIAGTIQNSGTFDATQGTIELKGTAAQVIPAGTFSGNAVNSLTINNTAGVSLNGTLYIYSVLKATAGTFITNDFLTLLSTPIQTALIDGTGAGSVTGNVTVQRYLPSAFGYKYLSSPYTGITVSQYAEEVNLGSVFPSFYSYDENQLTTGWDAYTNPAGVLSPGKGYALNFGTAGTPLTVITKGVINNGPVSLTLFNNNKPYTLGFNLVGNPYPSPIDWNAAGWTKTNIDNAIYYFDAGTTNQYQGTYSSYINGISSNGVANNIIPAQQAFFVHVKDGTYPVQGTLTFTNTVRINNLNASFHKQSATAVPLVRLGATYQDSGNTDYLVVYLNDLASDNFDSEADALKIMNTDVEYPNFYIVDGLNKNVSIKAIQFREDYEISLGMSAEKTGYISITADTIQNLAPGIKIFVKDTYSGIIRQLNEESGYTFSINNASFNDRFKLIFSSKDLSEEAFGNSTFTTYVKNGSLYLNSKLKDEQALVRIFDLAGKVLLEQSVTGGGEHNLGAAVKKGIYIVTVYTDMGIISNKVYLD